ncbi:MAG: VTT domain-containing protein [Thermomicrobium sp.]|nr:VTT domain-containing protein [Thermomicrobium sp.]MDW8059284.1 VTT domain-containing protein [Thermomicrobium sp.]
MSGLDLVAVVRAIGILGVAAVVFTESGLLVGLLLPGDSLLFTAGFLAAQGFLDVRWVVPACALAAIAGDQVGYAFGLRVGRALFYREDSRWFKQRYLLETERFFEHHGGKAVVLARFVPIVRTCTPIVAGVGRMRYRRFVLYNVLGGVLWGAGVTLAGYWLGSVIPGVDRYLLPIVALIVLVSLAPSALHLLRRRRSPRSVPDPEHALVHDRER